MEFILYALAAFICTAALATFVVTIVDRINSRLNYIGALFAGAVSVYLVSLSFPEVFSVVSAAIGAVVAGLIVLHAFNVDPSMCNGDDVAEFLGTLAAFGALMAASHIVFLSISLKSALQLGDLAAAAVISALFSACAGLVGFIIGIGPAKLLGR